MISPQWKIGKSPWLVPFVAALTLACAEPGGDWPPLVDLGHELSTASPPVDWRRIDGREEPTDELSPRPSGEGVFIPFGSRVEFFFELPAVARLELGEVRFIGGAGSGRVELIEDGRSPLTLTSFDRVGEGEQLAIDASGKRLVCLAIEAISAAGASDKRAGVLISRARVVTPQDPSPVVDEGRSQPAERAGGNVLLYVIDTLRADRVDAYGGARGLSPNLDRFAADATLFEHALAQSSWTRASMASIFTGMLPRQHGVTSRRGMLPEGAPTMAEALADAGYRTAAMTANPMVSPVFGFDQGIETHQTFEADDPRVLNPAVDLWLEELAPGEPFFLWVHTLGPHDPYDPPPEFRRQLEARSPVVAELDQPPHNLEFSAFSAAEQERAVGRWEDLYDGEVRLHDQAFGELLRVLERRGLMQTTLIIVVSDHGEEFLEHGRITHGRSVFGESVLIPLLIRFPGRGNGQRVAAAVQHLDLMPTVLEWAGLPVPVGLDGRSLQSFIGDDPTAAIEPAWIFLQQELDFRSQFGVTDGRWKLIQDRSGHVEGIKWTRLFDLVEDPAEHYDLSGVLPIRRRFLERLLQARLAEPAAWTGVDASVDGKTARALKALGYLQ